MAADRHLLFGLLALQTGLIQQAQLVAAFHAWTCDKSKSLADHLIALGHLDGARCTALEALAAMHVQAQGGEVERSLAAIPAGHSTYTKLAELGDPQIDASLVCVGSGSDETTGYSGRTTSYAVRTTTSDGQRFRVLRPHAHGGLGAVFVALDTELHREVAVKQILEQHADDPVSRQRFLLEAEVTGGLEHPGIVPVYSLGAYDDGRPYYAMRFVRGDSLKEAIEHFHADKELKRDAGRRSLELRKLLRRFLDVCNAIDYAHSRGVLHRDIKPANVIVGTHGETLVVDWGLAKATGKSELGTGERTLLPSSTSGSYETLPGSALGTPAYMSPEQAQGELQRLGPRSDVYSLGATLYFLLTGKPPLEGSNIGDLLSKAQRADVRPPRQVNPSLDKALESICRKAMALNPEDRYASGRALADDAERWMADEPVSAWREPWPRTLIRWLTRHRVGVTAAAAVILMALIGTGAVVIVQTAANAELKRSNTELGTANERVNRANADLQAAGARERQRFDLAMEAIKLFHGDVSNDLLLKEKQFGDLRANLLKEAADFYGKLEHLLEDQPDAQSRAALGRAYFELGELTGAIGKAPEALATLRKALAVRRELSASSESDVETVLNVVRTLRAIGVWLGDTSAEAEKFASYQEALGLAEGLVSAGRGGDDARFELAECLQPLSYQVGKNRPEEGLALARRGQAICRDLVSRNPSVTRYLEGLAKAQFAVGYLLGSAGKPEAITAYKEAIPIHEQLVSAQPEHYLYQDDLGKLHNNIAAKLAHLGKFRDAVVWHRKAVEIWRKAAERYPASKRLANDLAYGLNQLANDLKAADRPAEALIALAEARPILQKLLDADWGDTAHANNLLINYRTTVETLGRVGLWLAAKKAHEKGLAIAQMQVDAHPSVPGFLEPVAEYLDDTGWYLWTLGRPEESLASFDRERALRLRLCTERPNSEQYRESLANSETNCAAALVSLDRLPEAGACCDRAIAIREDLIKKQPTNHRYHQNLAESLMRLGIVKAAAGDAAKAATLLRRAAATFADHPPKGESAVFHACCHGALAALSNVANAGVSAPDGAAHAEKAMAILRHEVASGYHDLAHFRIEPGLDALRSRKDFQKMIKDLGSPIDPSVSRVDEEFRPVPATPKGPIR
jgi:serine/threonine-protein kinase